MKLYDILVPQNGESPAELISRRMETFADLLGDTDLSRRMQRMLRFLLTLLVDLGLSFAALDQIVETPEIAVRLAAKCNSDRLQRYFRGDCVLPTPAIAREIRSPICNEGRKAHRIATFFNRNPEKYPTATSGRSWTETTIKRILKREGIGLPQIVP